MRVVLSVLLLLSHAARAQESAPRSTGGALQASNLLNPNISAVGWLQAETGRRKVEAGLEKPAAVQFKEVELALQSVVDPYAKADVFISVDGDGRVDLEEGYLDWFHLPYDLGLKAGKFRPDFGKFNRTHAPETAFADRPLVHEKYFGEEGLSSLGAALSWHVPNPWLFLELDAETLVSPDSPAFGKARRKDLLHIGRLSGYYDLTESANMTLGASYAYGAAGQEFNEADASSQTLRSQLYGVDLTFRWKDNRRAVYRSVLWQIEVLWSQRDDSSASAVASKGLFSHLEYQFARRWRAGGRFDWTESPADNSRHEHGGLLYVTFMPSEFCLLSLQGRAVRKTDGTDERLGFLKLTFNIGPHGAHPF